MNRLRSIIVLSSTVLGCGLLTGCHTHNYASTETTDSDDLRGAGYGAFGEDPAHPGAYASSPLDKNGKPTLKRAADGYYYP